jgi:hypothetical protein
VRAKILEGGGLRRRIVATLERRGCSDDESHMRHFRLWLLVIGLASLVAEAIAAAAVFWHGGAPRRS